jgi:hypothetical protein
MGLAGTAMAEFVCTGGDCEDSAQVK